MEGVDSDSKSILCISLELIQTSKRLTCSRERTRSSARFGCLPYNVMAKSARLNVLSVFLSFLVQGNTFTRFFTFCSLKEIGPLFQIECSV